MPFVGSGSFIGQSRLAAPTGSREQTITIAAGGGSATSRQLRLIGMSGFSICIEQTAGVVGGTVVDELAKGRQFRRYHQFTLGGALNVAELFPTTSGNYRGTGRAMRVIITAPINGGATYFVRLSATGT